MIQVKIYDERVTNIYYGETLIEGFIRIDSIPSPEEIPGKIPVMYYRNGAIVYEYEEAPETTEDGTETPPVPMDYGETVNGLYFWGRIFSISRSSHHFSKVEKET